MITELNKNNFYKCKSLINENGQLEGKAIIERMNPGRIFVDNPFSPKTGLIWLGNNDGFLFFGNEENDNFNKEINAFIDTVIIPEAKEVNIFWFEAMGNHPKWNQTIKNLFAHRQLKSWNQKVYQLQNNNYNVKSEPTIDQDYTVFELEKVLSENNKKQNIEFLHSKILEFWSSIEQFLNNGIGYCVIYRNQIVRICFSGFVVENYHCVNIETLSAHQGKKLAQAVAFHFVQECLKNKQIPYWDCMEENTASNIVAKNTGFTNVFDYNGYYFSFK
ncbi:GNAT family N-acetyltransferase [Heyndrickxia oleronia]|uniref:GNAT family N-acetyltransferase n=1 Tax=Heyndrickxia oleronia TaxID=38875 RepID=UPI001C0EB581|nr:GNAT family N-acetyltransferase [Heyndrickxia oleronia]MBU5210789.1 GNAT family N-acetyltransferase [Heyndrickxia oleronia]